MEEKIVFKVVEKRTRFSSNFAIFRDDVDKNKFRKTMKDPTINRFCKKYSKGEVVREEPGSIGILCFKTERCAIMFRKWLICRRHLTIVKVLVNSLDEKQTPKIIAGCGGDPYHIISYVNNYCDYDCYKTNAPSGTVAYSKVRVLE